MKSKLAKKGGRGSEIAQRRYWCKLCNIWCTDKGLLTLHNKGRKHILKPMKLRKRGQCLVETDGM